MVASLSRMELVSMSLIIPRISCSPFTSDAQDDILVSSFRLCSSTSTTRSSSPVSDVVHAYTSLSMDLPLLSHKGISNGCIHVSSSSRSNRRMIVHGEEEDVRKST